MNQRETAFADMDARVTGTQAHEATAPQRHIGRPMQRLEDPAILTGRGRYGDDVAVKPGTLHAAILRSPHAHADILSIDAEAASKLTGVRAVLTRDDLRPWSRPFVVGVKSPMEQWALAMDRVRYVGEWDNTSVSVASVAANIASAEIAYLAHVHVPTPPHGVHHFVLLTSYDNATAPSPTSRGRRWWRCSAAARP